MRVIILYLSMVLSIGTFTQADGWRGLAPLKSTRADVERVLGTPVRSHGVSSTYEVQEAKVLVFYSNGGCDESGRWDVPSDTVISITVHPSARMWIEDLKLDTTKYERTADIHVQGIVYYFNKDEGITIEARLVDMRREFVLSITYEPSVKDRDLLCPNPPRQQTWVERKLYLARAFDEYFHIPIEDEQARLDNLAIYLQTSVPDHSAYIVSHAGLHIGSGEAKARAERAKDYLVNVRGIAAKRITVLEGESQEKFRIRLYVLPRHLSEGKQKPPPKPK